MKEMIDKAISLGMGLAATGKEQIEKAVDELVKKGEISRGESSELMERLIHRGEQARQDLEELVQERVQSVLAGKKLATFEELEKLEQRVRVLEEKVNH